MSIKIATNLWLMVRVYRERVVRMNELLPSIRTIRTDWYRIRAFKKR